MKSIQERIIEYIGVKGITPYKFCKDLGLSMGYLDKRGAIGTDKYLKIIKHYKDLNPEWLLTGEGDMLKGISKDAPPGSSVSEPQAAYGSDTASLIMRIRMLESEVEGLKRIIEAKDDQVKAKNELIEALRVKEAKPVHK